MMTFKQEFNIVHSSLIGARACNQIGTPWPNCRGISSLVTYANDISFCNVKQRVRLHKLKFILEEIRGSC